MPHKTAADVTAKADIVVVGTGFASTFFLHRVLERAGPSLRVAVLERGPHHSHEERIAATVRGDAEDEPQRYFEKSGMSHKDWRFSIAFGGSSNCWTGNTPRMLPQDFRLRSLFGQGVDWPFTYEDLESYYLETEQLMQISGTRPEVWPASGPMPLPPHRPNKPDVLLSRAWPGLHVPMPTARASRNTAKRSQCCANGVCGLCPVNAKFTIMNDMGHVYADPRVSVYVGTEAHSVVTEGGRAIGVAWQDSTPGAEWRTGELRAGHIVLGANAFFNAAILMRSGDTSPQLGKRLHEQVGVTGEVLLDGLESFQGSTYITGLGLQLYADDERRRTTAAALIETKNVGALVSSGAPGTMRAIRGRWRQLLPFRVVIESLPSERNEVRLGRDWDSPVVAHYQEYGEYAQRALDRLPADLERVFAPLPVERIDIHGLAGTESHIQGTTVMGADPASSVTDQDGLHHRWRDVRVLGASLFPTGAPANPTLTLSAHALRAADRMGALA